MLFQFSGSNGHLGKLGFRSGISEIWAPEIKHFCIDADERNSTSDIRNSGQFSFPDALRHWVKKTNLRGF